MVNTLIKNYDKQSLIMDSLGIAFSIHCLLDSNNDRKEVRKFQDRLISTFKNYPPNLWGQRLAEIRQDVEDLKSKQFKMGAINFVISASLGYVAFASTANPLIRIGAGICSATCGTAAVMNGVNYYNLHELIERLQRDGRLN
ncbi:unnamed protein product [Adineta ricciae]|nr:unnamed protein product [Adineta ricciae]